MHTAAIRSLQILNKYYECSSIGRTAHLTSVPNVVFVDSSSVARGPLLQREINQLARAALKVRQAANLDICLFGGTSFVFYGMQNRVPHDVNLVVMKGEDFGYDDPEALEHLLVRSNSRPPPCRLLKGPPKRRYKVDILVPGQLSIPPLTPLDYVYPPDPFHPTAKSIPVMPLLTLIVLKLPGWMDHRYDSRPWTGAKVAQDAVDIREMLWLAAEEYGWTAWFT
ncbi:hypothetical protein BKA70DRAFT_1509729 [Coprinopsis sp. MPI-PUGE-AT-0042]|nr:hypothetical protein BKA70DRAFT_1509729 [Coprinopsis sp. MPI-PUGE-AT-0042]